jgi:hypothetical protein
MTLPGSNWDDPDLSGNAASLTIEVLVQLAFMLGGSEIPIASFEFSGVGPGLLGLLVEDL